MSSDASPRVKGYEVFFGFREPPFSLSPDPRFLFDSSSHAAARQQVAHALERREPLVVVTGEIGTGKTLLCRSVVQKLERRTFLSIINDPLVEPDELLKLMLQDFGVISKDRTRLAPTTRHELVHALQEFLLSLAPLQANAVLIVDEAQHLQPDVMEQLRLISNVHDDAGALLQIVLVGQPRLEATLSRPELRQVRQRVSRHIRLEPLGIAELSQYIDHRLAVARDGAAPGQGAVSFAPEALSAIWRLSGGTPRVINLLCDRALESAYEQQARSVGAPLVEAAAAELGLQRVAAPPAATVASVPIEPFPTEELPVAFDEVAEEDAPSHGRSRALVVAAVVVVAAAAGWFGIRAFYASDQAGTTFTSAAPPPAERQPPPAGSPAPEPTPSAPASEPAAPPPPSTTTPQATTPPSTTQAAPPVSPPTAPPSAAPSAAAPGSYEIVVASFRTMTRASQVAAELAALGQPVRRRTSDGWEQVLAGPFSTLAAAEEARVKLDRAGYTGTQIVPAAVR